MAHAIVTKLQLFLPIAAIVATGGGCAPPAIQSIVDGGGTQDGFQFTVGDVAAADRPTVGGVTGDGCAFQSFAAERLPLDLLVLVDASGSMGDPVAGTTRTKWSMASEALTTFARDPGAAGTGIGLQFFPLLGPGSPCATAADCGYDGSAAVCAQAHCSMAMPVCDPARYARPAVDISDLPAGAMAFASALGARQPDGVTPMAEAVIGSLNYLRARATAMPRRRAALVIATDGLPSGCSERDIPVVGDSIWTAENTPPIVPTYVIGLLDAADAAAGEAALTDLARAGGSGTPFLVTPAGDLAQRLLAALDQIRGDALPCAYAIPTARAGDIDFGEVNVHVEASSGASDVPYVGSAAHCDAGQGGWYYDVDPQAGTPTHVIACPASCARLKADPSAKVELRFGCKTIVIR